MTDVTIITSTLNAVDELAKTADSIRRIKAKCIQWIVVDGGSADGTADLIVELGDLVDFYISEPDEGIYDAWNKALPKSQGKWIMFLGAGDEIHDEWPRIVCEFGDDHGFVYGDLALKVGARVVRKRYREWSAAVRRIGNGPAIPHVGTAHNRRLFESGRLFDANFRILGDWDFLARNAAESGIRISGVQQATMLLGGVSNNPANAKTRSRERREILMRHHLKMSTWRKVQLFLKDNVVLAPEMRTRFQVHWHRLRSPIR